MSNNSDTVLTIALFRPSSIKWLTPLLASLGSAEMIEGSTKCLSHGEILKKLERSALSEAYCSMRFLVSDTLPNDFDRWSRDPRQVLCLIEEVDWALVSWGEDYTSQMIALASRNPEVHELARRFIADSNTSELVVSEYSARNIQEYHFRGTLIDRWPACANIARFGSEPNPFVITYADPRISDKFGEHVFGPKDGMRCLRVHSDEGMIEAAMHYATSIFVSADVDTTVLTEFVSKLKDGPAYDPLPAGLQFIKTASWIAIPNTWGEKLEVIMARDPGRIRMVRENPKVSFNDYGYF